MSNDEHDNSPEPFEGVYTVDDDTERLLEVVVGMLHMLANTQVDEEARENCIVIAHELADRFGIEGEEMVVEEQIHTTDEGEEIIYKPRGGVFGDEPEEAEGPAPE